MRFVWIMGADNLRELPPLAELARHRRAVPIAVVDRLGSSLYAAGGRAAQALGRATGIPRAAATTLADRQPPAWVFLHGLKSPLSSTALRARAATAAGEPCPQATVETVAAA